MKYVILVIMLASAGSFLYLLYAFVRHIFNVSNLRRNDQRNDYLHPSCSDFQSDRAFLMRDE